MFFYLKATSLLMRNMNVWGKLFCPGGRQAWLQAYLSQCVHVLSSYYLSLVSPWCKTVHNSLDS